MTIDYAWECNFCGAGNAAGTDRCAACGNNAIARPIDFDPRYQKDLVESKRRAARIDTLPPALRPVVAVLWGGVVVGGVIAKFAWTIGAMMLGIVIAAVAAIPAAIITAMYQTREPGSRKEATTR